MYDSTRNLTWLADMNHAMTSGFDSDGRMDWYTAMAWADQLVYCGYGDWRLPLLDPADTRCDLLRSGLSFGCHGSELGGLFVTELGHEAYSSVLTQVFDTRQQLAQMALFRNVMVGAYWSSVPDADDSGAAWVYVTQNGSQQALPTALGLYALPVRVGDVRADVPEPHTLALAMLALGAAWATRLRGPAAARPV